MHYRAGPAGAKGAGFREVAGYSVTGRPGNGFLLAIGDHGSLYFTLVGHYRKKKTQGEGGITDGFS